MLSAEFDLPVDISELFPYINAISDDAKMFDKPVHIRFTFLRRMFALYPLKGVGAPFETLTEAQDITGKLIVYLNDLHEKKETITPNNTLYKPIPIIDILRVLPRTNCGICGFTTCMAFAASLSKGEVAASQCPELTLNGPANEE
jgi:ArsR family metal-binding transcriptional regulator